MFLIFVAGWNAENILTPKIFDAENFQIYGSHPYSSKGGWVGSVQWYSIQRTRYITTRRYYWDVWT